MYNSSDTVTVDNITACRSYVVASSAVFYTCLDLICGITK